MARAATRRLEKVSPNTRALIALGLAVYVIGVAVDWSWWVSIASVPGDRGVDHFVMIYAMIFGVFPALFWPIQVLSLAWNSPYCAMLFGIMCKSLFGVQL